jgi:dsRNA-specific ribonuclease
MEYEPEMVESLIGNERLAGFVESWGLRPHFNSLYTGDNNDFTAETIADYIEALFGFVYANDKRKVVSLIVKIISN